MDKQPKDSIKMKYALDRKDSYVMSANVENETTASSLRAMNYVSKALKIRMEIDTTSLHKGSIERFFKIVINEKDEDNLLLRIYIFVYQMIFYNNQIVTIENVLNNLKLEDQEIGKELLNKRNITDDLLLSLYNNNGIRKSRNTFYKTLDGYKKVSSISIFNGCNFDFSDQEKISEVKSDCFKNYISDLSPKIIEKDEMKVYLEAPVVVQDDQLKWIGVYNSMRIRFKMDSAEFKTKAQNGDVPFKNGLYIICKLEYKETKDEEDNIERSDYKIKEVYGYGVEENYVLTLAGKKKKVDDNMPSFYNEEHFK